MWEIQALEFDLFLKEMLSNIQLIPLIIATVVKLHNHIVVCELRFHTVGYIRVLGMGIELQWATNVLRQQ